MALTRALYNPSSKNTIYNSNHICKLGYALDNGLALNNNLNSNAKMNQRMQLLMTLVWLNIKSIHCIDKIPALIIPYVLYFLQKGNDMTQKYIGLNDIYLLVSELNTSFIKFKLSRIKKIKDKTENIYQLHSLPPKVLSRLSY